MLSPIDLIMSVPEVGFGVAIPLTSIPPPRRRACCKLNADRRSLAELPLLKASSDSLAFGDSALFSVLVFMEPKRFVRFPPIPALTQPSDSAMSSGFLSVEFSAGAGVVVIVGRAAIEQRVEELIDLCLNALGAYLKLVWVFDAHRDIEGVRKAGKEEVCDRSRLSATLRSSMATKPVLAIVFNTHVSEITYELKPETSCCSIWSWLSSFQ